jgi:lipid-A-disaccharide synthase
MSRPLRILISAAEASSCLHASHLIQALLVEAKERQLSIELAGIGDEKMSTLPFRVLVRAESLLAMGTIEVLMRLPQILRAKKQLISESQSWCPDLAVLLDYPGFHFKLAAELKSLGVRCINYIPPKVWVWRSARLKKMKHLFARVLCIFPFEKEIYERAQIPVDYIGNPLTDELPMTLTREEARRQLGLDADRVQGDARVVVFLPGSRPSELRNHIPIAIQALRQVAQHGRALHVLVPFVSEEQLAQSRAWFETTQLPALRFHLRVGQSAACMRAADVGLIKSGTSTLEAGVLGLPHLVVYKPGPLSLFLFEVLIRRRWLPLRMRGYQGPVGLVNLFSGWKPGVPNRVPELFGAACTSEAIAFHLSEIMENTKTRAMQLEALRALTSLVFSGGTAQGAVAEQSPSRKAARIILDEAVRAGGMVHSLGAGPTRGIS